MLHPKRFIVWQEGVIVWLANLAEAQLALSYLQRNTISVSAISSSGRSSTRLWVVLAYHAAMQ